MIPGHHSSHGQAEQDVVYPRPPAKTWYQKLARGFMLTLLTLLAMRTDFLCFAAVGATDREILIAGVQMMCVLCLILPMDAMMGSIAAGKN